MTTSGGWFGLADGRSFEPPIPLCEIRVRLHGLDPGEAEVSLQFFEPGADLQRELIMDGGGVSPQLQRRIVEAVTREVSSALAEMY